MIAPKSKERYDAAPNMDKRKRRDCDYTVTAHIPLVSAEYGPVGLYGLTENRKRRYAIRLVNRC